MFENLTQLQKVFGFVIIGLVGYWVIAISYEVYLRFTEKCVNCIVEDPRRLRFFKRLSLVITLILGATTVVFLFLDMYVVFVTFVLGMYFLRIWILTQARYKRLLEEEDTGYNPNMTLSQDFQDTLSQFKLLLTKPVKFFQQNR